VSLNNLVILITSLIRQAATYDAVANGLRDHPWVHFACHGHLLLHQPFDSSFELHDNVRLTLLDLILSETRGMWQGVQRVGGKEPA
jgi:CHAT domain-containing protein